MATHSAGSVGFYNQMFYCTNFTGQSGQKFWASSSTANQCQFCCLLRNPNTANTAQFDAEVGASAPTTQTINPGTLMPTGPELVISSLSADQGSILIDSGFLNPPDQPASCANQFMSGYCKRMGRSHHSGRIRRVSSIASRVRRDKLGAPGASGNVWQYTTTSPADGTLNGSGPSFIEWSPITLSQSGTLDTLSVNVHAVATTCNFRLALYDGSGNLVVASAPVSITAGGPFDSNFTASISPTAVTATSYFIAFAADNDVVINTFGTTLGSYQATIYSLFPQSTLGAETGHVGIFILGAHFQ